MKKVIVIIGLFISSILILLGVFGLLVNKKIINIFTDNTVKDTNTSISRITLDDIVNKFNNASLVKEYKEAGSIWTGTNVDNKGIKVTIQTGENEEQVEYVLNGNILSATFKGEQQLTGTIISSVLIDSIGQLHGYSEGQLSSTLNSDLASTLTLEKEGVLLKQKDDSTIEIAMDITKKVPLLDVSNTYIEVSDLENLKEFISGNGSAESSNGNIWFNKSGYDGNNTLLIAEKNLLTDNTYKSLLSLIEVMFNDEKVLQYFKDNYSDLSAGNKQFTGFNIEVNPINKSEFEEKLIPSNSEYQFIRVTINKNDISL